MRDPARIARIISMLHVYWLTNPDLRLGQLMVSLTPERFRVYGGGYAVDMFNVEDTEWEEIFRQAMKEGT